MFLLINQVYQVLKWAPPRGPGGLPQGSHHGNLTRIVVENCPAPGYTHISSGQRRFAFLAVMPSRRRCGRTHPHLLLDCVRRRVG